MSARALSRPRSAPKRRSSPVLGRAGASGALAVALLVLGGGPAVAAQPALAARPDVRIAFDISPRPLSGAVEAYALATGVQVLYDRPPGEGLLSPGVKGLLTSEAALAALLEGTGLIGVFTHSDSVILRSRTVDRLGSAPASGPPPDVATILPLDTLEVRSEPVIAVGAGNRLNLQLYGGLVSGAVRQALMKDRATASGRYEVTLKLWIGPSGDIVHMVTAVSSGDDSRDLAIAAVIRNVVVSKPPPQDLQQPVVLVVHSLPGA